MAAEQNTDRPCWFVGASFGPRGDQTDRFIEDGIWEHGFDDDDHLPEVQSIQPGDRIVIKSTTTQKHNLPFYHGQKHASVMDIKAIGTVSENLGDGRRVRVDWQRFDSPRRWYLYPLMDTLHKISLGNNPKSDALIAFAFEGKRQDLDWFRGIESSPAIDEDSSWMPFYEEVADKIWGYWDKRDELIAGIHALSENLAKPPPLQDQFADGTTGPLRDICPFTVMGLLNPNMTDENRQDRANKLAGFLKVQKAPIIPSVVPVVSPWTTWFFNFSTHRGDQDIDLLWELFEKAIAFAASDNQDTRAAFVQAYDATRNISGVKWNITMGLYWIRPLTFVSLDETIRPYVASLLDTKIPQKGISGQAYLDIIDSLKKRFEDTTYIANSFPELSRAAWKYQTERKEGEAKRKEAEASQVQDVPKDEDGQPAGSYTLDKILADGCFMERERLEQILNRWKDKHNLILQGPPGTGKTWLAKRLAYALIDEASTDRVRAVQFHPNLSYEDFVRGYRPDGEGRLDLMDGPFVEMMEKAKSDPDRKYVVVIEEVNRGEPAKIFGELLTLLESDKRNPQEALTLTYRHSDAGEYIPANLYVIGTMNIADRSLALVDLALRRRFAFVDLEPTFGPKWRKFVQDKYGESEDHDIDADTINEIELRMNALNNEIEDDTKSLGKQFRVGHSYVTPANTPTSSGREWFRAVVDTDIGPLLEEYWFDNLDKAKKAKENLLKNF